MTLQEYIKGSKEDSNFFWRLHPGDMQNLLDEAVEVLDELRKYAINDYPRVTINKSVFDEVMGRVFGEDKP